MVLRALSSSLITCLRQYRPACTLTKVDMIIDPSTSRLLSSVSSGQQHAAAQPPRSPEGAAQPSAAASAATADAPAAEQQQSDGRPEQDSQGDAAISSSTHLSWDAGDGGDGSSGSGASSGGNGAEDQSTRQTRRSRSYRKSRDRQDHAPRVQADYDNRPLAKIRVLYPVRVSGFGRLAMRRDVMRLLADVDVDPDEIRVEYVAQTLNPRCFWANLATAEMQRRALAWNGSIVAGRPVSVTVADPVEMRRAILNPLAMGSRGRYVLVSGIQDNATLEDIVRFFEGYDLMGNPVTALKQSERKLFTRGEGRAKTGVLRALVRFARTEEAHRAVRERQLGFLLNQPVTLRVLQ